MSLRIGEDARDNCTRETERDTQREGEREEGNRQRGNNKVTIERNGNRGVECRDRKD